ncbi:MAG: hypothetical protein EX285_06750, partial [Thaumarchaeota archaeon]|nr:hypothetical protein [Nitrososphaerota archaeon]
MIEPFYHLVERSVFEIKYQIKKDYAFSIKGVILLSNDLKKRYIDLLSTIMSRKRLYKARTGIRRKDGNQKMEEYTIIKMKCFELKES